MDKPTHTLNGRLSKIFGAVVPSDEKFNFKLVDYKNPEKPGRLAQFLASRTFPASYRVFLVNEGNRDISSIEMSTGGFEGTADTVIELNRLTKNVGPLKQGGSLLLDVLKAKFAINCTGSDRKTCDLQSTAIFAQAPGGRIPPIIITYRNQPDRSRHSPFCS